MLTLNNIHLVHYSNDLLKIIAHNLVEQTNHLLPDLRSITVFLPNQSSQSVLRENILIEANKLGVDTILPPDLITLRQWVRKQDKNTKPVLSQYARELILVDAIKQQPDIFSNANPWGIASELLSLFDAMLLNNIKPLAFNNYCQNENKDISHALLHESDLIKVLWEAWLEQITHENFLDPILSYTQALKNIKLTKQNIFFCAGLDSLSKLECDFLNRADQQSSISFYAYASNFNFSNRTDSSLHQHLNNDVQAEFHNNKNHDVYSSLLDEVYTDNTKSIKFRAETFANANPDPIKNHLSIYKSNSFEQHTKAIDLQVRIWISENIQNIGIVTTDRKLVRRLRAILEHANILVGDEAGWALSTTSAAVVVEWWLQLIEERYPAKQLLALANSPFFPIEDYDLHEEAINFFEKEVILANNLHSGIHHFRDAIEKSQLRNSTINEPVVKYLDQLLDKFESNAQLLEKLHTHKTYPLHRFINVLLNSLKPIGLYTALSNDDAGKQIIDLFEDQIGHFKFIDNDMNWSESRRFLSRILDQQNYKPHVSNTKVTFLSLEQSRLQQFDALIIASVDKNNFPGASSNYVFFNEQVRAELNVPTWRDDHARHLHQFRSLLSAAEKILITVQTEQNGEKTTPSPWLEAIETFYYIAYKDNLQDANLKSLTEQSSTSIKKDSDIQFPGECIQPNPRLLPKLQPERISISQYQSLIDCPYQYFALSCLNLSPVTELQEELDKADFGSLVHRCIHAFFSNQTTVPGPFTSKVTTHNRKDAENMLEIISKYVFSQSSKVVGSDGFSNELWLQRWVNLIPKFIDWEINRQANFTPQYHEIPNKITVNDSSQLHGRLDRVDKSQDEFAVIDYKTGFSPTKKSIIAGEKVQLPMYALLNENGSDQKKTTTQVEFVSIGEGNTVKSLAKIKGDELDELKAAHLHRLKSFFESINKNAPFTALATDDTCERCDAYGICRKSFW